MNAYLKFNRIFEINFIVLTIKIDIILINFAYNLSILKICYQ
jgi:hypothetical protein